MRRFSIAALMLVVMVCGVATAALKSASDAWAGALTLLTLGLLGSAAIGAVYRRGGARAWWVGFALFGWGYLALATVPGLACPNCGMTSKSQGLPTSAFLDYLRERLHPRLSAEQVDLSVVLAYDLAFPGGSSASVRLAPGGPNGARASVVGVPTLGNVPYLNRLFTNRVLLPGAANAEQFARIGHCLFALLAAVIGGLIARGFQRTNRSAI